jgi:hypothetical protein
MLGALAALVVATTARADVGALADAASRSHAGDHAGAIRIYEDVYARDHDPALLAILGHEYTSAGRLRDALQHFCTYLVVAPNGDDATVALAQLEILRAQLGVRGDACAAGAGLAAPGTVELAPSPAPATGMSWREQVRIGALAAGVVGVAAGIYFDHRASATSDQISAHDPTTPWPDNIHQLEAAGKHYELERDVALGLGASALIAAGVLYVWGREERLSVTPIVSRGGGGLAIGHGF